jgi:hypothetical protein
MIVVSRTPFITGTDERGGFTIKEVPAGRYRLKVSGDGRETTQELEVTSPRTDVTLAGR